MEFSLFVSLTAERLLGKVSPNPISLLSRKRRRLPVYFTIELHDIVSQ
jgi:hypothetical protein